MLVIPVQPSIAWSYIVFWRKTVMSNKHLVRNGKCWGSEWKQNVNVVFRWLSFVLRAKVCYSVKRWHHSTVITIAIDTTKIHLTKIVLGLNFQKLLITWRHSKSVFFLGFSINHQILSRRKLEEEQKNTSEYPLYK